MDEVTLIYRIRCFLLCKGRECERTTGACCVRALAKDFLTIPGGYYTTQTGRYLTMQADTATFQGSASPDYIMYARSLYARIPCTRAPWAVFPRPVHIHSSNIALYSVSMAFFSACALLVPANSAILFSLSAYPRGNLARTSSVFSSIYRLFAAFLASLYSRLPICIFTHFL